MTSELVELGDGLHVPRQGYGAMSLTDVYGPISDKDALRTLTHALDSGLTFIDTANVYGSGRSERIIAQLLKTRRGEVQIATKFGIVNKGGFGNRTARGDAPYARQELEGSLQRLGVDHVDLYYQHRVDPGIPIEETVGAIAELVHEGKVRHIGLSEATASELRRAATVHPIAAIQTEWSIISRDVEAKVIPAAKELGTGFVPYSPLSRGWLSGTYDPETAQDNRHVFPRFSPEALVANQPVLDEVAKVGAELGATSSQISLAWLYAKGEELNLPVVPIPGTRFADRVDENASALDVRLSDEHVRRLDQLADQITGHRSFDPAWVSAGRE